MKFCACTQKTSTSLLRICVCAQIIQRWKTLLSKITIRSFCACTQKASTSVLKICVNAQKLQQMIIIQSSNNPIVDVLRPAQKLQVWNTYIPAALGCLETISRIFSFNNITPLSSSVYIGEFSGAIYVKIKIKSSFLSKTAASSSSTTHSLNFANIRLIPFVCMTQSLTNTEIPPDPLGAVGFFFRI